MSEGAYLMDRIRARCREDGDCLIWTGAMNERGPVVTVDRKQLSVRRVAWEERNGKPFPTGKVASVDCEDKACIEHIVPRTRSQLNARTNRRHSSIARAAKVSATKRQNSKLSDADVIEIRMTDRPMKEIAAEKGISTVYAYLIRRGDFRRDYSSPFAGLGAR